MTKTKKPRVYFCDSPSGIYLELSGYAQTDRHYPVAVIPCRTQKEARAWTRLANRVADSYPRSNKVLTKHDYYCLRYLGIPTP